MGSSVGMEVGNDRRRSYACLLHRQTTYGRLLYDMIPPTIVQTSSTFESVGEQNPKMEFTVSSAVAVHWHHRNSLGLFPFFPPAQFHLYT